MTKYDYSKGTEYPIANGSTAVVVKYRNAFKVEVKIKETGTRLIVQGGNLRNGKVADPNARTVCGVGYIGIGEHRPTLFSDAYGEIANPLYALWVNMINRCYGKFKRKAYHGVTVCDRWLCFQHFANDVRKLRGFNNWLRLPDYELDKDLRSKGKRIYSPATCCFIPKRLNVQIARKKAA